MKLEVTNTKPVIREAAFFNTSQLLRVIDAPIGYFYAVGLPAFKAECYLSSPYAVSFQMIVWDGGKFRVYGEDSVFYKHAKFVAVEPGTQVTLTQGQ